MKNNLRVVTNFNCNQKCNFCYQKRYNKNYMTVKDLQKWVSILELRGHAFNNITVMGGEPLLNPYLDVILNYSRSMGRFINLDTNGLKIKDNKKILKRIDRLTIDIGYPVESNFIDNIELLKQKIAIGNWVLNKFPNLELKYNLVYSDLNKGTFKEYLSIFIRLLSSKIKQQINNGRYSKVLVTICEDVLNENRQNISMYDMDFMNYLCFKENIGLHLFKYKYNNIPFKVGYFKKEEFNDTDLILWKHNYTTNFDHYLRQVREGGLNDRFDI